jgi:hypothetical protein
MVSYCYLILTHDENEAMYLTPSLRAKPQGEAFGHPSPQAERGRG